MPVSRRCWYTSIFSQDKDMEDLQEFESLVSSAGVEAMQVITGSRKAPHPKYFVGEGKAVEIAEAVKATGASVVLFDHALSPAQERNLERLCECRVIDRTGLILDILPSARVPMKGNCRLSWHSCAIWPRAWFAAGPTLKDRKAGLVCAARVKPSSKLTVDSCAIGSCRSCRGWRKCQNSVSKDGGHEPKPIFQPSRWWDTPTPENQRCSTR